MSGSSVKTAVDCDQGAETVKLNGEERQEKRERLSSQVLTFTTGPTGLASNVAWHTQKKKGTGGRKSTVRVV
jgi:hypothetical protein